MKGEIGQAAQFARITRRDFFTASAAVGGVGVAVGLGVGPLISAATGGLGITESVKTASNETLGSLFWVSPTTQLAQQASARYGPIIGNYRVFYTTTWSAICGRGADLIVVDPWWNDEAGLSETLTARYQEWLKSCAYTRLSPNGRLFEASWMELEWPFDRNTILNQIGTFTGYSHQTSIQQQKVSCYTNPNCADQSKVHEWIIHRFIERNPHV